MYIGQLGKNDKFNGSELEVQTHARETVHRIRSRNAAGTDLVCDHGSKTDRDGDPGQAAVCCPAVEQVTQTGVDEADA